MRLDAKSIISFIILVAVLIAILIPYFANIFQISLCCADDGYFSMIAKTFGQSGEYGLPVSSDRISLFDGEIGTGPALILPVAFFIKFFDAQRWIPGSTNLLIFSGQLFATGLLLAWFIETWRIFLYFALSLLIVFAITPYQNYIPYLLGEPTAFGYLLIAAALLARKPKRLATTAFAGLSIGLAFTTKFLSLFGATGIALVYLLTELRSGWRGTLAKSATLGGLAILPQAIFEIVKLITLGSRGYAHHWQRFLEVTKEYHSYHSSNRLAEFATSIAQNYQVGWPFVIAVVGAVGIWLFHFRSADQRSADFCLMLFAGATFHLMYFFSISRDTPRYCWPGMAFLAFSVASPLLILPQRILPLAGLAILLLAAPPYSIWHSYTFQTERTDGHVKAEQEQLLDVIEKNPGLPLVAQSWHSSFDILYLLPANRRWWTTNRGDDISKLNAIVFFNEAFIGKSYQFYGTVISHCTAMLPNAIQYKAYKCSKE